MTGYCPDCGNTLCICDAIAQERASRRVPQVVWTVIYYAALLGFLVAVASRQWWFVLSNAVVAALCFYEGRRR